MTKSKDRFTWAETQPGWKGTGNKIIPFESMCDEQLNECYLTSQKKELHFANKSYVFADKAREIEEEAERRSTKLTVYDTDFHRNKQLLKDK